MNNIIDDLYLGNLNPSESTRIIHKEYNKLAGEAVALEEWLSGNLEGDGAKKFGEFVHKECSMGAVEARLRFVEGFRLGAQIMLDVLTCPELR